MKLTTRQLEVFRSVVEEGGRRGSPELCAAPLAGACLLADFPLGAVVDVEDLAAGAMTRIEGPLGGTALVAMDPETALAWARERGGPDPVASYLEAATELVAGILSALAGRLGVEVRCRPAVLREDAVVGILLATHAPSDTLILSARLELALADGVRRGVLYLLADPKLVESALASVGG